MLKSLGQLRLTGPNHWYVTIGYTYWHRSPGPVGHQWFIGSGWQARSEKLYSLAGEVARKLDGREYVEPDSDDGKRNGPSPCG